METELQILYRGNEMLFPLTKKNEDISLKSVFEWLTICKQWVFFHQKTASFP